MKRIATIALALCCSTMALAEAGLQGKTRILCTTEEVRDCVTGSECLSGLPAEYGAPASLRINLASRQILGEKHMSPIRDIEKKGQQLLLQGREMGYAWTVGVDLADGGMTLTLVNREGAFVLFGHCKGL